MVLGSFSHYHLYLCAILFALQPHRTLPFLLPSSTIFAPVRLSQPSFLLLSSPFWHPASASLHSSSFTTDELTGKFFPWMLQTFLHSQLSSVCSQVLHSGCQCIICAKNMILFYVLYTLESEKAKDCQRSASFTETVLNISRMPSGLDLTMLTTFHPEVLETVTLLGA